jgi:mercuric ion transport protein
VWRDRWFTLGIIGALLSCLACLTPLAVLLLGALGLGALSGHLDAILVPVLLLFAGLVFYRVRIARRGRL